jgi:multiple sugar transport system permease protein
MRRRKAWIDFITYAVLTVGSATMLAPLLWMLSTSLKDPSAGMTYPPELLPRVQETWQDPATGRTWPVFWTVLEGRRAKVARLRLLPGRAVVRVLSPAEMAGQQRTVPLVVQGGGRPRLALKPAKRLYFRWRNYPDAWHALQLERPWLAFSIGPWHFRGFAIRDAFLAFYLNSLLVTVTVTAGEVFLCSLAAYGFARLRFPARDVLFLGYLATLMVPAVVTMIPVFILLRLLRLVDTYTALILPAMFSAYGTFMLRQFFLSIPRDLEEAARLDGCGLWGVYRHVVLPLSRPALAALATFAFLGTWNSFMWPLIVINSTEKMPLMLGLYSFMGQHSVEWHLLMAAAVMVMAPVILVFLLGQRYFVEGVLLSGVKG